MEFDISRCNNLRWFDSEENVGGLVKVVGKKAYFYTDEIYPETVSVMGRTLYDIVSIGGGMGPVKNFFDEYPGIRIVPRDPETYTDWQEGDLFVKNGNIGRVVFRMNDLIGVRELDGEDMSAGRIMFYLTEEFFSEGARLELTGYENFLSIPEHGFMEGDRVLVRDNDVQNWEFGTFIRRDGNRFRCRSGNRLDWTFSQCIPYDGNTWALLGTAEKIK